MSSKWQMAAGVFLAVVGLGCVAEAGTAHMDFNDGIGLFSPNLFGEGPGVLSALQGRASISDRGIMYISAAAALNTAEATMTLCPGTDAVNGVGLQIGLKGSPGSVWYSILATVDGTVTVTDGIHGVIGTALFPDPSATDCTITWSGDRDPSGIWVLLNGVPQIDLSAYPITSSWFIGVRAEGPAGFEDFVARGDGVPDYPNNYGHVSVSPSGWIEEGMHVVLTAPGGSNWQWYKNAALLPDETGITIEFAPVVVADSGTYEVRYDDGTKTTVTSYPLVIDVLPAGSLPLAWWPVALVLLAVGVLVVNGVERPDIFR